MSNAAAPDAVSGAMTVSGQLAINGRERLKGTFLAQVDAMNVATTLEEPGPVLPAPPTGSSRGSLRRLRARASLVLLIAMHLACLLVIAYPPTWPVVLLALGSYLLRMWAITVGFHRYFAHRSFRISRALQFVLALLGTTAMQNGPIWWASLSNVQDLTRFPELRLLDRFAWGCSSRTPWSATRSRDLPEWSGASS